MNSYLILRLLERDSYNFFTHIYGTISRFKVVLLIVRKPLCKYHGTSIVILLLSILSPLLGYTWLPPISDNSVELSCNIGLLCTKYFTLSSQNPNKIIVLPSSNLKNQGTSHQHMLHKNHYAPPNIRLHQTLKSDHQVNPDKLLGTLKKILTNCKVWFTQSDWYNSSYLNPPEHSYWPVQFDSHTFLKRSYWIF